MRDHGGNLDWAMQRFGGAEADWIDLSTGINRARYKVGALSPSAWTALPNRTATEALRAAARTAYGTKASIAVLSGAQGAIQLIPHLGARGTARVLTPTYNEHAAALRLAGWQVDEVATLDDLSGADLAVVVNPNNPDGTLHDRAALLALLPKVGRLVVDESFADPLPSQSLADIAGCERLIVLRSFGKFYGLAGLRLGFALGHEEDIAVLTAMAGPWPVAGVALEIGTRALLDRSWQAATCLRLADDAAQMDRIAASFGWQLVGGTHLFRTYATRNAALAQEHLGHHHVWSRIFPYSDTWLRLGLPGNPAEWDRLADLARQPQ
jgi:cobalamin biosynthesis protein CobC